MLGTEGKGRPWVPGRPLGREEDAQGVCCPPGTVIYNPASNACLSSRYGDSGDYWGCWWPSRGAFRLRARRAPGATPAKPFPLTSGRVKVEYSSDLLTSARPRRHQGAE